MLNERVGVKGLTLMEKLFWVLFQWVNLRADLRIVFLLKLNRKSNWSVWANISSQIVEQLKLANKPCYIGNTHEWFSYVNKPNCCCAVKLCHVCKSFCHVCFGNLSHHIVLTAALKCGDTMYVLVNLWS